VTAGIINRAPVGRRENEELGLASALAAAQRASACDEDDDRSTAAVRCTTKTRSYATMWRSRVVEQLICRAYGPSVFDQRVDLRFVCPSWAVGHPRTQTALTTCRVPLGALSARLTNRSCPGSAMGVDASHNASVPSLLVAVVSTMAGALVVRPRSNIARGRRVSLTPDRSPY